MNKTIKLFIKKKDHNKRVDIYLSNEIKDLTRSHIKKLIQNDNLKINNLIINTPSIKIKQNDLIDFNLLKKNENELLPKKISLNIVYEDNDILIINKPKGMVVHPGAGNYESTLANALAFKYKNSLSDINGHLRPGIIHRIDKDTSGLLVIAKNNSSHSNLGKQFSNHTIKRKYQCLVWGVIRPLKGKIITLIARSKKNRKLMQVTEYNGKKAITNYKTLKIFTIKDIPKISLVECELETGRTHQIRVHLNYKGSPILGDNQYGKRGTKFKKVNQNFFEKLNKFRGQALHAKTLEFKHPKKNKWLSFDSNLPDDFKKMLNLLEKLSS